MWAKHTLLQCCCTGVQTALDMHALKLIMPSKVFLHRGCIRISPASGDQGLPYERVAASKNEHFCIWGHSVEVSPAVKACLPLLLPACAIHGCSDTRLEEIEQP
jgi:hypothetical protein